MNEKPTFFATPKKLKAWFDAHAERESELWVGFYKVGSGKPSITWPESVDEALCVGWIDGVRKSIDETSYKIRFTPRKTSSRWSNVNVNRVGVLTAEGRMRPAGLRAFAARTAEGTYAYEQRDDAKLTPEEDKAFRKNKGAFAYFEARPAWYKKSALYWVVSAKRPETRAKRLATLILDSSAGRTIAQLTRTPAK